VSISDSTLKDQANVRVKPDKEKMLGFIERLQDTDEVLVVDVCKKLALTYWIPWLNKENQANKLFFAKKGGIYLCVKWMKEAKSTETRVCAGTVVWNFAESGPMHEILFNHGAVDALLGFLKSDSQRLQRVAIGALFGLLDYDSNQGAHLALHYDKDLVATILNSKQDIPCCRFRLAKIGCLLSLAKHPITRAELLARGGLLVFKESYDDTLVKYMSVLGVAHLIAGKTTDPAEHSSCIQIIRNLLKSHTPRGVREQESKQGVVWSSTRHLLRLLRDKDPVLRLLALFSVANMSYGDYNRSMLIEEEVLGEVLCTLWTQEENPEDNELKQTYLEIITSNFSKIGEEGGELEEVRSDSGSASSSGDWRVGLYGTNWSGEVSSGSFRVPSLFSLSLHSIVHKSPHLLDAVYEVFPNTYVA
jgi:hypothetical protein